MDNNYPARSNQTNSRGNRRPHKNNGREAGELHAATSTSNLTNPNVGLPRQALDSSATLDPDATVSDDFSLLRPMHREFLRADTPPAVHIPIIHAGIRPTNREVPLSGPAIAEQKAGVRELAQDDPYGTGVIRQWSTWLPYMDFGADRLSFFISSRGNEYFCEIDEDYLTDRFNLTGLSTDVLYYQYALDLITDVFDQDCDDDMRDQIEKSARHLYGLIHARYITTTRGLAKMLDKYKKGDFGKCPRHMCSAHPLLPTGMADLPHVQSVKLYCGKCEDVYNPKSSRHANIDGAYFGTSFQNILYQVYPALIPEKSIQRHQPRIFGFKVHAAAALERWQAVNREEMQERLRGEGIRKVFKEGAGDVEDGMEEEQEGPGLDGADNVLAE